MPHGVLEPDRQSSLPPDSPPGAEPIGATRHEEPLTGERTWPGIHRESYWFLRHLACYQWIARELAHDVGAAREHPILDAGAGEGYGSDELRLVTGRAVVAAELDGATSSHISQTYPQLDVVRANLVALPFADEMFSAVVSLQVIEHIWDPVLYLRELDRCSLGPMLISTPNRPIHSPGLAAGEIPLNPFHVREFDEAELTDLISHAIPHREVQILGLHHGDRIHHWEVVNGSLAGSLIDESPAAFQFAAGLNASDFEISASDTDVAQDLIAVVRTC